MCSTQVPADHGKAFGGSALLTSRCRQCSCRQLIAKCTSVLINRSAIHDQQDLNLWKGNMQQVKGHLGLSGEDQEHGGGQRGEASRCVALVRAAVQPRAQWDQVTTVQYTGRAGEGTSDIHGGSSTVMAKVGEATCGIRHGGAPSSGGQRD